MSADVLPRSLRNRLAITPRQDGSWRLLAAAYRPNTLPSRKACLEVGQGEISLDHIFGSSDERVARLSAMRSAVQQLYAVLNKQQRQTADRVLPLCCLVGLKTSCR